MDNFKTEHCVPCEGNMPPLSKDEVNQYLAETSGWTANIDFTLIERKFEFNGFNKTINFINALAWIVNKEGHHPSLEVGFNYCIVKFTTHAIKGLSKNDFICAAKINALIE